MPPQASAQRVRVGTELRRLRVRASLSGEHVARALGWSQSKVSRIEGGLHSITVKDVAGLLDLYGVSDDVRAELLGVTAADNGEGAWIVRAGSTSGPAGGRAAAGPVTTRIRQYQPVVLPGLLQTREYARSAGVAAGSDDPDALAETQMRRQETMMSTNGPEHEIVLDARALLLPVAPVDVIRAQILSLVVRAQRLARLHLYVIPLDRPAAARCPAGFVAYDFRAADSPSVAWVESPTGHAYFAAPEDLRRYEALFAELRDAALDRAESVRYLRSLADDLERHLCVDA